MRTYKCRTCDARYGGPLVRCPRCRKDGEALVMALNKCEGCTTLFAVGLRECPNCRSQDFHEEGTVPKITVHGGPTNAALDAENARLAAERATSEVAISPAAPEVEPLVSSVPDQGPVFLPAEVPASEAVVSVEDMSLAELREECEKRGLSPAGNKAALRDRLAPKV